MAEAPNERLARSQPVRAFAIEAGIVLAVFTTLAFVGIFWRTYDLVYSGVRDQAASYVELVMAARGWNAEHAGVWVNTGNGVQENPYLKRLHVQATTETASGRQMVLIAPEPMTAEIAQFVQRNGDVTFRLTSLKPLDPANKATSWETAQLKRFETDLTPVSAIQNEPGKGRVLRVIRPLVTEQSCLQCHAAQGYKVGDIRGALSVTVPLANADAGLLRDGFVLAGIWAAAMITLGVMMYALLYRMAVRVDESEDKLRRTAATDELTQLPNRRAVLERLRTELARALRENKRIGVISIDVDRFKEVNDTHGHAAGDAVLQGIAQRLSTAVREYDTVGRVGGEEFLVIAPDVDEATLKALGERLRAAIEVVPIGFRGLQVPITISAGGTVCSAAETPDTLMRRADEALYRAKDAGRNRFEYQSCD